MIPTYELLFVSTAVLAGACVVADTDLAIVPRAALGWLSGVAVYSVGAVVLVVAGVPTSPLAVGALTLAVGGAALTALRRRDLPWPAIVASVAVSVGAAMTVIAFDRILDPVRSSRDSYDYSLIAGLLANGSGRLVEFQLLRTRLLGYPALHLSGFGDGEIYLSVTAPLTAIAALATFAWLVALVLGQATSGPWTWTITGAAVVVLVTSYHFAYHAFYVNSHVVVGGLVLASLAAATVATFNVALARSLVPMASVCVAALVLMRPEGGLLALLVVAATTVARTIPRLTWIATAAGTSMIIWNGHLFRVGRASDAETGQLMQAGATAIVGAVLVALRFVPSARRRVRDHGARGLEILLWTAFVLFAIADWATVGTSLSATFSNLLVGRGTWGPAVPVILVAFAIAAAVDRRRELAPLSYVGRTFFPLMFVLAPVRDAPYRVGTGDSLNRSLMHILFAITVVVVVAAAVPVRDPAGARLTEAPTS